MVNQFKDKGRKFDLIISVGLPPKIIKRLIEEGVVKEILKPGGVIFLAYDIDIGSDQEFVQSHGFNYFQGMNIMDRHMAVYRKNVD